MTLKNISNHSIGISDDFVVDVSPGVNVDDRETCFIRDRHNRVHHCLGRVDDIIDQINGIVAIPVNGDVVVVVRRFVLTIYPKHAGCVIVMTNGSEVPIMKTASEVFEIIYGNHDDVETADEPEVAHNDEPEDVF